jgi:predicted PurR-regulated permease PerM
MATKRLVTGPSYLRIVLGLALTVAILYLGKPFIVPLALAVLLTFVLNPIVSAVQGWGLPRVAAVLATVVLTFIVLGAVGWGVGIQISNLARELPENKERIQKKIADLRGTGEGVFAKFLQMVKEISEEPGKPIENPNETPVKDSQVVLARPEEPSAFERLAHAIAPVLEPLAVTGLVIILVIFMLIKREDLRNRLIGLLGHGHLTGTTRVIIDAAQRVSSFLLTQLLINVAFGILFGVGLLFIGVPYAFLWGFLTAAMRFVPYVGTWISVAFPLVLSFALSPGWVQPLVVLAFFGVLDLVTANVVEPLLFGHNTGVTPIALLIAAAFWTWIWGPIGLVLSTPLTVCLVVLGQHVPRLKFFQVLLGDQPALEPHVSYYQRLLARDVVEAGRVAAAYAKVHGLENVYDDVLLPALVLARRDRKLVGLVAEDEEFIVQATREIVTQLDVKRAVPTMRAAEAATDSGKATDEGLPPTLILGCPAHDAAEELSLHMLAGLVKSDCHIEVLSTKALPAEVEAQVAVQKPALAFIAILPPGGLVQARYLCKRLRKRFADLPIVVGYWGESRNFDRLLKRLRAAGASYVATSLLQSRSQIGALVRGAASPPAPQGAAVLVGPAALDREVGRAVSPGTMASS